MRHAPSVRRLVRAAFAVTLVAGLSAVPAATVMACDCASMELAEAVRNADLAIVGTLIGSAEGAPGFDPRAPAERVWTWNVERSRDPLDAARVDVLAWDDDGANCGVSFAPNERWLVLAHLEGQRLHTNSCMRSQRLDGSDPDGEALIASLVLVPIQSSTAASEGLEVPVPILFAAGMTLVVGLVGVVAFKARRGDSPS